jgi:hypothetical protein
MPNLTSPKLVVDKGMSRATDEDKRAAALRENLKKRKSQAAEKREMTQDAKPQNSQS